MKTLLSLCLCLIFIPLEIMAQEWAPELTEQWEPVPPVVTPGEGMAPPSDAIVLFDGTDLAEWEGTDGSAPGWDVEGDVLTVAPQSGSIRTKRAFGDIQLHLEWRAPMDFEGPGQDKGNSGIFLQGRYEVQVLDCHDNETYVNGTTASVYKQYPPLANPCKPTGEWHAYDIIYTAPRFKEDGTLFSPATVTVLHNGVLVQNHVTIMGTIKYIGLPEYETHDLKQPLMLQDHGNPTSFRNIWVREL